MFCHYNADPNLEIPFFFTYWLLVIGYSNFFSQLCKQINKKIDQEKNTVTKHKFSKYSKKSF